MTADTQQCNEQVSKPPYYLHSHQCTRNMKVQRDGKPYCAQHDPVARAAKADARFAAVSRKQLDEVRAETARRLHAECAEEALKLLQEIYATGPPLTGEEINVRAHAILHKLKGKE